MTTKPETIRALMTLVDKHTDDFKEQEYLDICDFLKQSFEQVNRSTTNEWFSTPSGGHNWADYQPQTVVATGWITTAPTNAELARIEHNTYLQNFTQNQSTANSIAEVIIDVIGEVSNPEPTPLWNPNGNHSAPNRTGAYDLALQRLNAHNNTRHRPSPTDWVTVITEIAPPGAISPRVGGGAIRVYLDQIKREINEYSMRTGWTPPDTFDVLVRQQMERRVAITRERLEERVSYWAAGTRGVN